MTQRIDSRRLKGTRKLIQIEHRETSKFDDDDDDDDDDNDRKYIYSTYYVPSSYMTRCSRHCSKKYIHMNSFNPFKSPMRYFLLLSTIVDKESEVQNDFIYIYIYIFSIGDWSSAKQSSSILVGDIKKGEVKIKQTRVLRGNFCGEPRLEGVTQSLSLH